MRQHAPIALLVTTAAVLSWQPYVHFCRADNQRFRFFSSSSPADTAAATNKDEGDEYENSDDCPFYGCRLVPSDVHYDSDEIRNALQSMRQTKRNIVKESEAAEMLKASATDEHVTLTLIGYKGGSIQSQINQDRSFVIPEYSIIRQGAFTENGDDKENINPALLDFLSQKRTLLGVFDGHAPRGELISEFATTNLPVLLADRLNSKARELTNPTSKEIVTLTKEALSETFIELDKTAPADPTGGCTASIILQQGKHIFIANAGDSRSFIVAYRPSTQTATLISISREDKPNLPDEKARVIEAGGQVYIPPRGTSRVVYHDPGTGAPTGLAMSRSIGDWAAGKIGVIPDPIIQVLDIDEIVAKVLELDPKSTPQSYIVDAVGSVLNLGQDSKTTKSQHSNDDVYLLGVSATDGLMDYSDPAAIGKVMAVALFDEAGGHPVAVAEHLIFEAASAWHRSKQGRYRDDIAISVAALRRPPE